MFDGVRRLLVKNRTTRPQDDEKAQYRHIHVAVCALFLEMAHIDGEFSISEQENMISILKKYYDLSDKHVTELMEASKKELEESVDLWQFTNLVNQNYSREEKIRLIEMVWQVVYADQKMDKHEDYLVHKLAKLLRLTHNELIDAKLRARSRISSQNWRSGLG
jgi:uncharacterized tellurite resistance protein B-like protein